MTVETDDDRLLMMEDWGVTAVVTGGGSIQGIFDDKYSGIDMNGMAIEADAPIFVCRSSDIDAASVTHGTALTINGTTYTVRTPKPDGTGVTALVLSDG